MIVIPDEIEKDKRLTLEEVVLLSIYHNYTVNGKVHCCLLTNEKLSEKLKMSVRQVQRMKRHLKELGLIETNGGIKVWYKGDDTDDTHNSQKDNEGDTDDRGGDTDVILGVTPMTGGDDTDDTHNINYNINNNKEEYKEEDFFFRDSLVDGMDYNNKNI